jgi:hypothetical protein
MRFLFVLLLVMPSMGFAQDMSVWRLLLVNRLQAANHTVVIGNQAANPFGEKEAVLAYQAPGRLVSVFVKRVPAGNFQPEWIAPKYSGTADTTRKGDIALLIIGADSGDAGSALLKKTFASATPSENAPAKIKLASKASDVVVQNRYWYKRWIESSPNQMVTGTFALSFVSEDGAALETLAADLKKAGLAVKWTLNVDRGTKSYWVHALLSDVWGPDQLTERLDALRLESYSGYGTAFFNNGWEPAQVDKEEKAVHPTGEFELFDERPR